MSAENTVLLLGGTGRTGGRVLARLLECGINVRAIVRSAARLPEGVSHDPRLTVIEADLMSLTSEDLVRHVRDCDAVISCLGHIIDLRGIFGPPRDLVTRATQRLCSAIEASRPARPVKFILMTSVSVNQPEGRDTRRGWFEKSMVWLLRSLVPPARDNQSAADFLCSEMGTKNPSVEWVTVRPDTLLEGDATDYELHDNLVSSLARPDSTNMANIAHFMCELVKDDDAWSRWRGKLPVIVNAGDSAS